MLAALGRRDEQQTSVGAREQLAVEQVGCHGIRQSNLVVADDDGRERRAELAADFLQHRGLVDVGALVAEQHAAVADRDHVVVEHAGVDRVGILLREDSARRVEAMAASDGGGSLARLPCGIFLRRGRRRVVGRAAVDEELDARRIRGCGESRVIGRALVAELRCRRQRVMNDESRRVGEDRAQHARRRIGLQRAVKMADEVRRREMDATVGGVGRGAHGRRVGNPHRGRRRACGEDLRRVGRGAGDDFGVAAGEAERAQRRRRPGAPAAAAPPADGRGTRARASSRAPAARLAADLRRCARCSRRRGCRAPDPRSCASVPGCRRN